MTKAELIKRVAERTGTTLKLTRQLVDTTFDEIASALEDGERLMFPGFGTFCIVERKERKGRNPRTGEEITIPAKKVVKFRAAKALQDRMG